MEEAIRWAASLSGIAAALMVSSNAGRKISGYGFVIFVFSSLMWIIGAALKAEGALIAQNVILLGINIFGVYRYLLAQRGT